MATDSFPSDLTPFALTTFIPRDQSGEFVVPPSAHTLQGFRAWALSEEFPDRCRMTFVGGELIIDMSPEFYETHNLIKTEITSVIYGLVKARRSGHVFSDRYLFSNPAADVSTEPDAMFARSESLRSGRCKLVRATRPGVGEELVGSPDWVLEILSQSSRRKDLNLLRDAYFKAGIREYWIVDALGEEIDLQVLVATNLDYSTSTGRDGWLSSPTFGCSFRLSREKVQDDFWQYTLQVQEKS
jgi:Uma2 family endonuclease